MTFNGTNVGLGKFCKAGYAPVLGNDGYYTIQQVFDITITKPENGTVTADKASTYAGDTVTLTVAPADGYKFVSISAKDANEDPVTLTTVAEGEEYTFVMPAAAVTVTAEFEAAAPAWPEDWPADVSDDMKKAFANWKDTYKVGDVDFSLPAVKNAFLMNVDPAGEIPELKIDSIAVEGTTATIVVGADVALNTINGVLFVSGTDDLAGEWKTTEVAMPTDVGTTATFTVNSAKFMKAKVDFKAETPVNE